MTKGRAIPYSADEMAWLEHRSGWPRLALHEAFVEWFGRGDVTADHIKALAARRRWKTGRTGCFQKGNVPANKGKKMPFNANSAATQFKKGQLRGRAREVFKPIGTERWSKEGYLERKINNDLPFQARWRAVHLINWEAVNGPLPKGMCLKSLDGNKSNHAIENWIAIPRRMLPLLNGRHRMAYDDAPAELKPLLLSIARLQSGATAAAKGERA